MPMDPLDNGNLRTFLHMVKHGVAGDVSTTTKHVIKAINQYDLFNYEDAASLWSAAFNKEKSNAFSTRSSLLDVVMDTIEVSPEGSLVSLEGRKAFDLIADDAFSEMPEVVYETVRGRHDAAEEHAEFKDMLQKKLSAWAPDLEEKYPAPTRDEVKKVITSFVMGGQKLIL